jgi:putative colanic acid biosynthesis acetyltransferase WcaF
MRQRLRVTDISSGNRIGRTVWHIVWLLLYRPTPRVLHAWRSFLLRMFGARIGSPAYIYPSSRVWAPWNLTMGDHINIYYGVECY